MEAGNALGHSDKSTRRLLVIRKLFDKILIWVLTALAHGSLCLLVCSSLELIRVGRHLMSASVHKVLIFTGVMVSQSGWRLLCIIAYDTGTLMGLAGVALMLIRGHSGQLPERVARCFDRSTSCVRCLIVHFSGVVRVHTSRTLGQNPLLGVSQSNLKAVCCIEWRTLHTAVDAFGSPTGFHLTAG